MTNDNPEGITFDRQSGISEDEQNEILAKINDITESRRQSLAAEVPPSGKGKQTRFTAKKSGNFFPVLVNSAAVAALVAGLLLLSSFQGKNDIQIRTGTRIYNSAERALIEEIRKETSSDMVLERLSQEQSRSATVEAQMGAFFANLYTQVYEKRLDDAASTIQSMRIFLNTPAFQALRSIQARKELYAQSINAFEAMVEEARRNPTATAAGDARPPDAGVEETLADLQARNAQLEQTIASIATQGSGTASRLAELERTNKTLEDSVNTLTTNLATQTRNAETAQQQATAAQTQITTLTQTVAARDSTINEQRGRINTRDNTISVIRDIVSSGEIADMTVGQLTNSLESIRRTLNSN